MAEHTPLTQENDEKYIRRCIELARNGISGAAPNPMVGAVIVHDGRIIGEGYHRKCGGPHAEVNAIRSVHQPELLSQSTIYVSLEPCAHYGKTPPCTDLIIAKHIPRVVIGCRDPFAQVDGLGIRKLQDAGCDVTIGVLEKECQDLNRHFMTYHILKRPFITLKWAQSADGYIGHVRSKTPIILSTPLTQTLVHQLRAHNDAILIGGKTALTDNPSLTTRMWKGRNPLRIVIDTHGNLPDNLKIFNNEAETLRWSNWNLKKLMTELYNRKIQTLLVEGGRHTLQRFIDAKLWDDIRVETTPTLLGRGTTAPLIPQGRLTFSTHYGENTIQVYRRN